MADEVIVLNEGLIAVSEHPAADGIHHALVVGPDFFQVVIIGI